MRILQNRKNRALALLPLVALALGAMACGLPTSLAPPTETPVPPTETPVPPTNTPGPTNTPAPTNTPEPEGINASNIGSLQVSRSLNVSDTPLLAAVASPTSRDKRWFITSLLCSIRGLSRAALVITTGPII